MSRSWLQLITLATCLALALGCGRRTSNDDDDDDESEIEPSEEDRDGDGYCPEEFCQDSELRGNDCDDQDAAVHPGATEACDTIDNDCDERVDEDFDVDQDGFYDDQATECLATYTPEQMDCNDLIASINPGADETCDGNDTDCNGDIDDGLDQDSDGYRVCDVPADCNDENSEVYPNAVELCDGEDSNCNGFIDDGIGPEFADGDGDGLSPCAGDCDDALFSVNPNATEGCDEIDNDCDGDVDEDLDMDGDGVPGAYAGCLAMFGAVDCDDDDPLLYPGAPESCDGQDNDCDGQIDEGLDFDGDGFTSCTGDCDSLNPTLYPGAPELCDGLDNDCNGVTDEGFDDDGDGQSDCAGDCNDHEADIYLGAPELCDGIDNDCDGERGPDELDNDLDGYSPCDGDCDDYDEDRYPGAPELCNTQDDNCDGNLPDDELDNDLDGFLPCTPEGCSVALVTDSDDGDFWDEFDALDSLGVDLVTWDSAASNGWLGNPDAFSNHQVILWYTEHRDLTQTEHDSLEAWAQSGKGLVVTGNDTLSNSSDFSSGDDDDEEVVVAGDLMASLVRSASVGDGPQTDLCVVSDVANPVMTGIYGSWNAAYTFTAADTNHENAAADAARGGVRVAAVGNRAKMIYTEVIGGGSILYWNGNSGLGDWDSDFNPDLGAMLRNAVTAMNMGCGGLFQGGDCDDDDATLQPGTCP